MSEKKLELGYMDECKPWQVESRLFPSKAGGKPAWLDLENLPPVERLLCKKCGKTMIFLCQIYAPYEENIKESFENYLNNFHRTLFVFICRDPKCCERNNSDNLKVFRSSLQRNNRFYSYDPPDDTPMPGFSLSKWVDLCSVCGCLSQLRCSKCKEVHYCSKEHQVLDWKSGHKKECTSSPNSIRLSTILFPEFEINTEMEELEEEPATNKEEEELEKFKVLEIEGKAGTMPELSEKDLEAHASGTTDEAFEKFHKIVSFNPDQVIRYKVGGEPLWIAKEPLPESIPDCQICGAPRQFEFQIMPQMLTFLRETELDFGVLVVYTCKASCLGDGSYREEFIFKQDVEISD
ncbi:zinc finger protein RP-8 [Leptinotarsa decemlineata]|uniref:zinc finger protein RP-8 n=1 Tax=Leptinotarsa decemlineata TaxID=7539 RepID=UPI003D30D272